MKFFKNPYRMPTPEEQQSTELVNAQRDLLKFEATVEYATAMRDMLRTRVERLSQPNKET